MATVEAGVEGGASTSGQAAAPGGVGTAIGMTCGAILLYTLMDAAIKHLGGRGYPVAQLLFVRCLVGLLPLLLLVWRAGGFKAVRSTRPALLFVRAALGLGSLYAFFLAFQMIPLAEAVALGFAAPLVVTALSGPILKERVGVHRWGAVVVGFCGVVVIARPGSATIASEGVAIALAGATLYALSIVLNRRFLTESTLSVVFFTTFYGLVVSSMLLPFGFMLPRTTGDAGLMALLGFASIAGLLLLTGAYRKAPASVLAPFDYTGIIYATLLGYLLFGERLTVHLLIGVTMIVASALYVLYRETGRAADMTPA